MFCGCMMGADEVPGPVGHWIQGISQLLGHPGDKSLSMGELMASHGANPSWLFTSSG